MVIRPHVCSNANNSKATSRSPKSDLVVALFPCFPRQYVPRVTFVSSHEVANHVAFDGHTCVAVAVAPRDPQLFGEGGGATDGKLNGTSDYYNLGWRGELQADRGAERA